MAEFGSRLKINFVAFSIEAIRSVNATPRNSEFYSLHILNKVLVVLNIILHFILISYNNNIQIWGA